ncbi:hypothetical protein AWZ03_009720 [Drosophila navojoa]|uniref:Uncharacterized protein n=1 Tax=Drosophila navojoa TaxID=7232 RepID=A0A484B4U2_DRONA|nr:hypothetical protein AWZ03_009720 [Drosophila navojoa]
MCHSVVHSRVQQQQQQQLNKAEHRKPTTCDNYNPPPVARLLDCHAPLVGCPQVGRRKLQPQMKKSNCNKMERDNDDNDNSIK